jgi:Spy/CpxP family protein refolding chaperone
LTPRQKEQVRAIWSAVRPAPSGDGGHVDRRHAAAKERDEAILRLVPADRKADYDRAQQDYAAALAEIAWDHERLMQDAEVKMKAVLSDAQWKKFEEIKRSGLERGRNGHPGPMHGSTHPAAHSTSRPAGGDTHDK